MAVLLKFLKKNICNFGAALNALLHVTPQRQHPYRRNKTLVNLAILPLS